MGPSSDSPVDRMALAGQVIRSAGDVLLAAGFNREEIGSFFHQAAERLQSGAEQASGPESGPVAEGPRSIRAELAEGAAVRKLADLVPPMRESLPLRDRFDLAMQTIVVIAEAQEDLRRLARKADLRVLPGNPDAPLHGQGEGTLIFADYEDLWRDALVFVAEVLGLLAEEQDEEAFAFMLAFMTDNGLVIGEDMHRDIAHWLSGIPGSSTPDRVSG